MLNTKLISLLSSFSKKELKVFTRFVDSPYYNTNNELLRLLAVLKNYHPDFEKTKLEKADIFQLLYPKKSYNDKRIRYLMSDLLKLGEQFVLAENLKQKTTENSLDLAHEFAKRKLHKSYLQLHSQVRKELDQKELATTDYFLQKISLTDLEEIYATQQGHRLVKDDPQQASNDLNRYFVLKKLKYACSILSRQAVVKQGFQLSLPPNWMEWISQNDYWGEAIISAYAAVFMALKHQDQPKHFHRLSTWLLQNNAGYALKDLKELHLYAINYCARRIREGKGEYTDEALAIYLNGIHNGALLEDGYFSPWSFGNVVKLALRLEKYDWIEAFMENHKHYLKEEFRPNTMLYNYAELYCYKKDFSKALNLLVQVEFSDLSYHLGSRIMLAKIYYELKEYQALTSLMNAFIIYLKRNKKISDAIRATCLNFCDFLFMIIRNKTENLDKKILTVSLLTDRDWLLEKWAELT